MVWKRSATSAHLKLLSVLKLSLQCAKLVGARVQLACKQDQQWQGVTYLAKALATGVVAVYPIDECKTATKGRQ